MTRHRRGVLALAAAALLPGCTAAPWTSSAEENSAEPIVLGNLDTKPHWLAVQVKGNDQTNYVQEFAAYLEAGESEELAERLHVDRMEGNRLQLQLRIDDEVRTDTIGKYVGTQFYLKILEDGSIAYGTDAR